MKQFIQNSLFISALILSTLFTVKAQTLQDYPWLSNIINAENCCKNESVQLYRYADTYDFIYIQNDANCIGEGRKLYSGDGAFWCNSYPEYDCLGYYNFQFINTIYDCSIRSEIDLLSRYPWLNTIVDEDDCCNNNEITLYKDKQGFELLEIFQIWLNLPKVSKMVEPHFKMLWKEDIPIINYKDEADKVTSIQIVASAINDVKALATTPDSWASNAENGVGVYTITMQANAVFSLPKTYEEANRSIFFYKGENIEIDGKTIASNHIIEAVAVADENITLKNGNEDAYFLILEGKPIGEPVAQHGPFVMNTQEEIREAMKDYAKTQFGGWPWQEREIVHAKEKGRFALHGDGTEEIK